MKLLTIADGIVKINNTELDGILTNLTISGEVEFDDQKMDGLSGTKKVPRGWTDADVNLTLDLITDESATCYERLAKINSLFKTRTNAPQVFDISNPHLSARGVRRVVFSKFDSSESNQDDIIAATLSFVEYEPPVVKEELAGSSSAAVDSGSSPEPQPEASLQIDVK